MTQENPVYRNGKRITRQVLIDDAADLKSRFLLLDLGEKEYFNGNKDGACHLLHAMYYLEDRIGYEMNPAPPRCIKLKMTRKEWDALEKETASGEQGTPE